MTCTNTNLEIKQGETYIQVINYYDSDGTTPIDLTGYTARMQIRSKIDSPKFLIELTTENNRIIINGSAGELTLTLTATETEALDFDISVYDLEIIDSGGAVTRLLDGNVSLCKEVTR